MTDGCRDFATLVRTNLCTEDQTRNLGQLLSGYDKFFYQVLAGGSYQPLPSASDQLGQPLSPRDRQIHRLWFIVARFLFHSPRSDCEQQNEDGWWRVPANSKGPRIAHIERRIFEYLDFGLCAALITGWFDPARTASILDGSITDSGLRHLTIDNIAESATEYMLGREKAVRQAPDSFEFDGHGIIDQPYNIPPRRLWDLKMNRVVPWFLIENPKAKKPPPFIAISHSWVAEERRVLVETPINNYAWPVPLPVGVDLEFVRAEILQAFPSFRYCWLDVLCLRQENIHGPYPYGAIPVQMDDVRYRILVQALTLERDSSQSPGALRASELRLDVPTIGNVYKLAKGVFRYYNGLGVQFSHTGWNNTNHWCNRAWTLQEAVPGSFIAGLAGVTKNYLNLEGFRGGSLKRYRDIVREIEQLVDGTYPTSIIALAQEMSRRHAANEIDKITGLSYLLKLKRLPVYSAVTDTEVAWQQSLQHMPQHHLLELMFHFPLVNSGRWLPSWHDLLACPRTFVPYPDIRDDTSMGPRARFMSLFTEFGYPKTVLETMYQKASKRYRIIDDFGCPGYPFALYRDTNLIGYCKADETLRAVTIEAHHSDGSDDGEGTGTISVNGYFLKAVSVASNGNANEYQVSLEQLELGGERVITFFLSHLGLEDTFTDALQKSAGPYTFFTLSLVFAEEVAMRIRTNGATTRHRELDPHSPCSAWVVLGPCVINGRTVHRKLGILRSDESFNRQWVKHGWLQASPGSQDIIVTNIELPEDSLGRDVRIRRVSELRAGAVGGYRWVGPGRGVCAKPTRALGMPPANMAVELYWPWGPAVAGDKLPRDQRSAVESLRKVLEA